MVLTHFFSFSANFILVFEETSSEMLKMVGPKHESRSSAYSYLPLFSLLPPSLLSVSLPIGSFVSLEETKYHL